MYTFIHFHNYRSRAFNHTFVIKYSKINQKKY